MALRVSADTFGEKVDLAAVKGGAAVENIGIDDGAEIAVIAEAIARHEFDSLVAAREKLASSAGMAAVCDVVAVAANFNATNRVADCIGLALDAGAVAMSKPMQKELGLDEFHTAKHTGPSSWLAKLMSVTLAPLVLKLVPIIMRRKIEREEREASERKADNE